MFYVVFRLKIAIIQMTQYTQQLVTNIIGLHYIIDQYGVGAFYLRNHGKSFNGLLLLITMVARRKIKGHSSFKLAEWPSFSYFCILTKFTFGQNTV